MSKNTKIELTPSQYSKVRKILKIPVEIRLNEFKNNMDVLEFELKGITYIQVHYKPYLDNIDPFWKQFRGIIIKNYDHIVAFSNGFTPTVTVTDKIPSSGKVSLREFRENGSTVEHELDFTPGSCYLRPAFQGTMIRVSLTDGEILRSTLRKGSIENSIYPNAKDAMTFAEKFNLLCNYGKELFTPGKINSPFCHVFLMCVPQVSSASHIEFGEGFIIYLETTKCYIPDPNDETEEQVSYLEKLIPEDELDEAEKEANIKSVKDRLFFPMSDAADSENLFASFIPPPTTIEFLQSAAAVYTLDTTMSIDEANQFLVRGVSNMDKNKLLKIARENPLLLPGEGLYYSGYDKNNNKVSYIIMPECYNLRHAIIGDPNNPANQLVKLRQLPNDSETIDVFTNNITIDKLSFNNVAFPIAGTVNYLAVNDKKPLPNDLYDSKGLTVIPKNKITFESRWDILAYFYLLALIPSKREYAFEEYLKLKNEFQQTVDFIIENQKDLLNVESKLYEKRALNYTKYFETSKKIRDIIETAQTKGGILPTANEIAKPKLPHSLPQKKPQTGAPLTFKKPEETYADVLTSKVREKDSTKIQQSIIRFLNEENAQSLYRIIVLVNMLITE